MTVAAILAEKGRRVVTVGPKTVVAEIIQTLAEHRIGAVVVTENGQKPIGIVSERDVVQALAKFGADALGLTARTIMTGKLVTCGDQETIHQVMETMTRGRFRHLPVLDNGRLAGIVSIGDVVKRRIQAAEREAEELRVYIATA